jgi:hypothetical protein
VEVVHSRRCNVVHSNTRRTTPECIISKDLDAVKHDNLKFSEQRARNPNPNEHSRDLVRKQNGGQGLSRQRHWSWNGERSRQLATTYR